MNVDDPVEPEEAQVDVYIPASWEVDSDGEWLWCEGWRHWRPAFFVFFTSVFTFNLWVYFWQVEVCDWVEKVKFKVEKLRGR